MRTRGSDEAAAAFAEVLRLGSEATTETIFYSLEGLADVAATRGDDLAAGRLWGASEAIRDSMRAVLATAERATHDEVVPASRAPGGGGVRDRPGRGEAMPTARAVELALEHAEG